MVQTHTKKKIPVIVDKSHLITIGEKLYTEKSSFIRELVNNAFDADATEVHVLITPTSVQIKDNGLGMDEAGLRKYFTIGASEKRAETRSPVYARKRIGEFGIGKFSALATCKRFEIETRRGSFHAHLLFDKEQWIGHEDWNLDIDILSSDDTFGTGTCVTLHQVDTVFALGKVRRYLAERTPIHTPRFEVYINNERVTDDIVAGTQYPVAIRTACGDISGVIIVVPEHRRPERLGIGVSVRGVLVRYETFGLETSRRFGVARITGKLNADFLTITSGRDDFLRDTPEFLMFQDAVKKELQKIFGDIREEGDKKANLQASRVLKDALSKVGKAMRRHASLFPGTHVPVGESSDDSAVRDQTAGYDISKAVFIESQSGLDTTLQQRIIGKKQQKKSWGRPAGVLGDKSVIRNLHVAHMDIAVRMEHLSVDEDESVTSGGVIFINLDHPLYKTYQNNDELLALHITRLLTKELALRVGDISAAQAFAIQSELLTGTLGGRGK